MIPDHSFEARAHTFFYFVIKYKCAAQLRKVNFFIFYIRFLKSKISALQRNYLIWEKLRVEKVSTFGLSAVQKSTYGHRPGYFLFKKLMRIHVVVCSSINDEPLHSVLFMYIKLCSTRKYRNVVMRIKEYFLCGLNSCS